MCARVRAGHGQAPSRHPAGRARAVPVAHAGRGVGDGRRGARRARASAARRSRARWSTRSELVRRRRRRRVRLARRHQARQRARRDRPATVAGRRALDVGASTGGFTDCLLQRGARDVIAVDVGYGELDYRLRSDPRVHGDRAHQRARAHAADAPAAAARRPAGPARPGDDRRVVHLAGQGPRPRCSAASRRGYDVLALVKPQFEVGRGRVGKGGVVRDADDRARGADRRRARRARRSARACSASTPRACPGPKGNRETFIWLADAGRRARGARDGRDARAAWRATVEP